MADPKQEAVPPSAYVNVLRVSHTATEFFLTFGQTTQETPGTAHLVSTLVTTPAIAKAMLKTLERNVERYEERHGRISIPFEETKGNA